VARVALGAGHGDRLIFADRLVAVPQPTTAGMPSSRAMIAAWQVRPPRLVTIAAARFMTGSQSGSVMSATSTSPGAHPRHVLDVGDDPRVAGADALSDAAPADRAVERALSVKR
jgi:hypothetical protein